MNDQSTAPYTDKTTVVYLTPDEALLFVEFQKRFAFIQALEAIQAFDIRNGSLTVMFDDVGRIRGMKKELNYKGEC